MQFPTQYDTRDQFEDNVPGWVRDQQRDILGTKSTPLLDKKVATARANETL